MTTTVNVFPSEAITQDGKVYVYFDSDFMLNKSEGTQFIFAGVANEQYPMVVEYTTLTPLARFGISDTNFYKQYEVTFVPRTDVSDSGAIEVKSTDHLDEEEDVFIAQNINTKEGYSPNIQIRYTKYEIVSTYVSTSIIDREKQIIGTTTTLELGNKSKFYLNVDQSYYGWKFRFASQQRVRHTNWTIVYDSDPDSENVVNTFVSYNSSYYLVGLWETKIEGENNEENRYWYREGSTYKFYGPDVTIQDKDFVLADGLIKKIEFDNENNKAKGGLVYLKAFNTNATSEIRYFVYGGVTYNSSEFWFKTDEINVYKKTSSTPSVTIWCKGILLHEEKQAEFVKVYRSAYSFNRGYSNGDYILRQGDSNDDYRGLNYTQSAPLRVDTDYDVQKFWYFTNVNLKDMYGRPESFNIGYYNTSGRFIGLYSVWNIYTYARTIYGWRFADNEIHKPSTNVGNCRKLIPYNANTPILWAQEVDSNGKGVELGFDVSMDTIQGYEFEFGKDAENNTDYTTAIFLNPDLEFWVWTRMSYFEAAYHTYINTVKTVKMENLTMYPGTAEIMQIDPNDPDEYIGTGDYDYDTEDPNVLYCEGMNVLLSGKLEIKTDTITQSDNTEKTFYPTNTNPVFDCNMLVTNGHHVDILIENNDLTCIVDDNNSDFDNFVFFGSYIYPGIDMNISFKVMNSEFRGIPKKLYCGQYTVIKDEETKTERKKWTYTDYKIINASNLERLYGPWIKKKDITDVPYYEVTVKDPFYTEVTAHGEGEDGDNSTPSATTYEQKDITFCMYTPNDTELWFDNSEKAVSYYEYKMVENNVVFKRDSIAFKTDNVKFSTNADENTVVLDGIIDENGNLLQDFGAQANYTYVFNNLEIGSGVTLSVPGGVVVVKGNFVNDGAIDCGALYIVSDQKAYITVSNYKYSFNTIDLNPFTLILEDDIFKIPAELYIFELPDIKDSNNNSINWKNVTFTAESRNLTIPSFVYTIMFCEDMNDAIVDNDEFYLLNSNLIGIDAANSYLYADIDIQDKIEIVTRGSIDYVKFGNYEYRTQVQNSVRRFYIKIHTEYDLDFPDDTSYICNLQMKDAPELKHEMNYILKPDGEIEGYPTYNVLVCDNAYFGAEKWRLFLPNHLAYPMSQPMVHEEKGYIRIERIKRKENVEGSDDVILTMYDGSTTSDGYKIQTEKYRIGQTMIDIYDVQNGIGIGCINYGWHESVLIENYTVITLNDSIQLPVQNDGEEYTKVNIKAAYRMYINQGLITYIRNTFQTDDILNTPGLVIPESDVLEVSNARVIIDTAKDGDVDVSGTLKCKELVIN